ncbi:MAG TPA: triose-phosphate isomerase [Alphaproteobacteria bacterium]|nr:triose-phosphate isomerase [Alphaproteobacteria bacterium]HAJ45394.1 triose-phosphate isomerase [Alphaproteobacteria bacterium]
MPARRPPKLVVGNWKMFGTRRSSAEVRTLVRLLGLKRPHCEVVICPPAVLLPPFRQINRGSRLKLGGQDCHPLTQGAHTGDISAEMLKDAGAGYVIVGHSERREAYRETDQMVAQKAQAALRAGLHPIVCIGETAEQNEAGHTLDVLTRQLERSLPDLLDATEHAAFTIAYEPVWAIGTGRIPSPAQIEEIHGEIRRALQKRLGLQAAKSRVIYGGSVKASNARAILNLAEVDGALVGGASLKATDFAAIVYSIN